MDLYEARILDVVGRYVMHERPLDATSPCVFLAGRKGTRRLEMLGHDAVVRLFARRLDKLGPRTRPLPPLFAVLRHERVATAPAGPARAITAERFVSPARTRA
ncbi:hypothetical protein [Streptomyces flavofungini]|uniref:hypothetical protein n=1 Tax=Streptomyces flavofungini TaxID=68200 RepID=UPI0034DE161A